jgi:alcohol dehydrogenase class IV
MRFEFATATRIVFGRGTGQTAGAEAAKLGKRALVVGGSSRGRSTALLNSLQQAGVMTTCFAITKEPEVPNIEAGVATARDANCDLVISFGGGSAIDAGKAIAAMMCNPGDLLDYLEVIGRGKTLPNRSAPFVAIPTTAGTGAEVTRNAVLASPEHKVKVSLRSAGMLPALAIVDPDLTRDLPPTLTASTGMDALTQLLEAFISSKANPMTNALCEEGLRRCGRSLLKAFREGSDMTAREDMSLASLFGGLALANAGLGAVHGFAGPIGGLYTAPHGAVCAALLPRALRVNAAALQSRDPNSEKLGRISRALQLLSGESTNLSAGLRWLEQLVRELQIPPLREYGITSSDLAGIVKNAKNASSMKANPVVLSDDELNDVLRAAL